MRSESDSQGSPFKSLGVHLKSVRENANQSLSEVSGAVEIDEEFMQRIERGELRPSEEILLLLISYFDISDAEATRLWEMAGYAKAKSQGAELDLESIKAFASILSPDLKIIYTDMVHATANDQGVTLNFMQSEGVNGQPMVISRLGMSQRQAKNVINVLQSAINQIDQKTGPKLLPPTLENKTEQ